MSVETVALDEERAALIIVDQTKLPGRVEMLALTSPEEVHAAISSLQVRGAPAIGIAAAFGAYLAARVISSDDWDGFHKKFKASCEYLASSRPTAVNLFWALERMESAASGGRGLPVDEIKALLLEEARKIRDEDVSVCRAIGEHGLSLVGDGDGIMTHCNAGQLATARYGTALAPIHLGRERGLNFKVFACETRPLLQGARLTALELMDDGVDTTLICDNMAADVMKRGWARAVFVGCDRVAANGDACNKIGTSGLAILAKHYGIPFYVFAPVSTIDMCARSGGDIRIEERAPEEVTELWYAERMAPAGVKVYNPAFDVTEGGLISAIITERGIARPPYSKSLAEIAG